MLYHRTNLNLTSICLTTFLSSTTPLSQSTSLPFGLRLTLSLRRPHFLIVFELRLFLLDFLFVYEFSKMRTLEKLDSSKNCTEHIASQA